MLLRVSRLPSRAVFLICVSCTCAFQQTPVTKPATTTARAPRDPNARRPPRGEKGERTDRPERAGRGPRPERSDRKKPDQATTERKRERKERRKPTEMDEEAAAAAFQRSVEALKKQEAEEREKVCSKTTVMCDDEGARRIGWTVERERRPVMDNTYLLLSTVG